MTTAFETWLFSTVCTSASAADNGALTYLTGLPWIHQWTGNSCLTQISGPGLPCSTSQSECRGEIRIHFFVLGSHVDAHVSCHWRNMITLFLLQDMALKYNNSTHRCPENLIQTQALCIRTQADMVFFSTDRICPITFDPQPTVTSVLVCLI